MSRLGKMAVEIPTGCHVRVEDLIPGNTGAHFNDPHGMEVDRGRPQPPALEPDLPARIG